VIQFECKIANLHGPRQREKFTGSFNNIMYMASIEFGYTVRFIIRH